MKRREFMALIAGAAAWPTTARAQEGKALPKIGVLSVGTIGSSGHLVEAFVQGLSTLGYIEDKTIAVERRYAQGRLDRLEGLADELVHLNVDIVFAPTGSAALAARKATDTIPIIFALVTDPIEERFVSSLNRPGGRMTGMTNIAVDLAAKRLEMLLEMTPHTSRIGVLYFTAYPGVAFQLGELRRAAEALNKSLLPIEAGRVDELPVAFEAMVSGEQPRRR
jgi:putative tryptophan/tyrosine transport system substrate-binding protein